MQSFDRALGVECTHCHVAGDWKRDEKPEYGFVERVIRMTGGLNA